MKVHLKSQDGVLVLVQSRTVSPSIQPGGSSLLRTAALGRDVTATDSEASRRIPLIETTPASIRFPLRRSKRGRIPFRLWSIPVDVSRILLMRDRIISPGTPFIPTRDGSRRSQARPSPRVFNHKSP